MCGRGHEPRQERPDKMSASDLDDPFDSRIETLYLIGVAAARLSVHPRTLRIYETEGLLAPIRRNNLRLYREVDLVRVRWIRFMTTRQGLNLAGIRILLDLEARGLLSLAEVFPDHGDEQSEQASSAEPRSRRRR